MVLEKASEIIKKRKMNPYSDFFEQLDGAKYFPAQNKDEDSDSLAFDVWKRDPENFKPLAKDFHTFAMSTNNPKETLEQFIRDCAEGYSALEEVTMVSVPLSLEELAYEQNPETFSILENRTTKPEIKVIDKRGFSGNAFSAWLDKSLREYFFAITPTMYRVNFFPELKKEVLKSLKDELTLLSKPSFNTEPEIKLIYKNITKAINIVLKRA